MSLLPSLLAQLRMKGVELCLSGDQLRYRASAEALDAETREAEVRKAESEENDA